MNNSIVSWLNFGGLTGMGCSLASHKFILLMVEFSWVGLGHMYVIEFLSVGRCFFFFFGPFAIQSFMVE